MHIIVYYLTAWPVVIFIKLPWRYYSCVYFI